jgi:hypothetical protein
MSGDKKIYVIDSAKPKSKVDLSTLLAKEGRVTSGNPGPSQNTRGKNGNVSAAKTTDRESGVTLLLSYLAGPLSILATHRSRKSRHWVVIAVVSVILSVVVLAMWRRPEFWSATGGPAGVILILTAVVAAVMGCFAWTRAVILAGRHEGPRLRRSPAWMRGPFAAGILGLICPGMGLYAVGRSKQAAAALWMTCITGISFILVSKAGWLWNFNANAGAFAIRQDTLEYMLAGASILAVFGVLAWAAQALNGMRLAAPAKDRKAGPGKNWAAVALLVSVIAFLAFFRPAVIAEAFDMSASVAENRGMKIIPLRLSLIAGSLDPSRPEYTVRAIELYEKIGAQAAADQLRGELISRLEVSLPILEEEGIVPSRTRWDYGFGTDPASLDASAPGGAAMRGPAIPTIPAELMSLDWGIGPDAQ